MKRRETKSPNVEDEVPAEFRVGRVIEVWADHDPADQSGTWPNRPVSAMSRYSRAWDEYLHQRGIDRREGMRLQPPRPMYSVDFLVAQGRRAWVQERLSAAGVTRPDLPDLRARVEGWLAAYSCRVGTR